MHCPGATKWLGRIFTVINITKNDVSCTNCYAYYSSEPYVVGSDGGAYFPSTLKRIDPLPKEETEDNKQELTV
jgi:hypothetical protein